jgi:hypothetical protein
MAAKKRFIGYTALAGFGIAQLPYLFWLRLVAYARGVERRHLIKRGGGRTYNV